MNQHHVHRYVLEHITGVPAALKFSNRLAGIGAAASSITALAVIIASLVSNRNLESNMQLALGLLLSGFPFAVLAQRYTLRAALDRKNLRLVRFLIGKKTYVVPKNRVLDHNLDLFAIAANIVCSAPTLAPAKHAAAWHTHRVFEELPGVAVATGWFGHGGQPYAFLYGDYKKLTAEASEIWDLGHIRKKSEADTSQLETTARSWKRTAGIPIAIAYAPLSSDTNPASLSMADIQSNITLLGLLNLQGTREPGVTFTPQPAQSIRTAARVGFIATTTLSLLLGLSFILGIAAILTPLYLLLTGVLAVILLPILTGSMTWDQFKLTGRPSSFTKLLPDMLFASLLLTTITCMQYGWYLERHAGTLQPPAGAIFYQGAWALAFGTLATCLIIEVILQRGSAIWWQVNTWSSPFFLLAVASALLLGMIGMYTTGPVINSDLLYLIGSDILYLLTRNIALYAETNHSRDHIVALLSQH